MNTDLRHKLNSIMANQDLPDAKLAFIIRELIRDHEMQHDDLNEPVTLTHLFNDTMRSIKRLNDEGMVVSTGFQGVDKSIRGFFPGELIVIGGRPAMGKTQLLVNLALNISKEHPLLYYNFDLPQFLLGSRFISALSKTDMSGLLGNSLNDEEEDRLISASEALPGHRIYISDSGSSSLNAIRSDIISQTKKHGIRVVMIDYLQQMSSSRYKYNRDQEISTICRDLKKLALEQQLVIIMTSQLSRAVEQRGGTKTPQLSDLRESGSIEQDADKVFMIHRMDYYGFYEDEDGNSTTGLVDLILVKNRSGVLGTFKLISDENFTCLTDYDERTDNFNITRDRLDDLDSPF